MKPNAQCPSCLQSFYIGELTPEYVCPNDLCGSKLHPKFFHRKCLVTINWDDLRALTWFSSQWVDANLRGTPERMSFLNIVRMLNSQRDALIKATGMPFEFGHLTPFLEEQEQKKAIRALEKMGLRSKPIVDTVNDILMEKKDEDDDENPGNVVA